MEWFAKKFGQEVQRYRREGNRLERLALDLDVSMATLYFWLDGSKSPDLVNFMKVAYYFGWDLGDTEIKKLAAGGHSAWSSKTRSDLRQRTLATAVQ